MQTVKQAMIDAGIPEPRSLSVFLDRYEGIRGEPILLSALVDRGIQVSATFGPPLTVKWALHGGPIRARLRTGWLAIRLRSNYGGSSEVLFEPDGPQGLAPTDDGWVSGWLRLKGR